MAISKRQRHQGKVEPGKAYAIDEALKIVKERREGQVRRSRSTSPSASASMRRSRTSRCAARPCCRTAPASRCASPCSPGGREG